MELTIHYKLTCYFLNPSVPFNLCLKEKYFLLMIHVGCGLKTSNERHYWDSRFDEQ